jgi:hypothetical protein
VQVFQVFDLLLALVFDSGFFTQQNGCLLVSFCFLNFYLNVKFVDLALALRQVLLVLSDSSFLQSVDFLV